MSRDPVYSTPNLYAYCGNNPVLFVDPRGLDGSGGAPFRTPSAEEVLGPMSRVGPDAKQHLEAAVEETLAFLKGKFKNPPKCQITLCDALGLLLDNLAKKSEADLGRFGDFLGLVQGIDGYGNQGAEKIRKLYEEEAKPCKGKPQSIETGATQDLNPTCCCQGFKSQYAWNGHENLRHYLGVLNYGRLGAWWDNRRQADEMKKALDRYFHGLTADERAAGAVRAMEVGSQTNANNVTAGLIGKIRYTTHEYVTLLGKQWRETFCTENKQ
jgi:hypothetical protein